MEFYRFLMILLIFLGSQGIQANDEEVNLHCVCEARSSTLSDMDCSDTHARHINLSEWEHNASTSFESENCTEVPPSEVCRRETYEFGGTESSIVRTIELLDAVSASGAREPKVVIREALDRVEGSLSYRATDQFGTQFTKYICEIATRRF